MNHLALGFDLKELALLAQRFDAEPFVIKRPLIKWASSFPVIFCLQIELFVQIG